MNRRSLSSAKRCLDGLRGVEIYKLLLTSILKVKFFCVPKQKLSVKATKVSCDGFSRVKVLSALDIV